MVQEHAHAVDVRVGVKMIDARRVEGAGAPDDTVNFVAFFEQQIGQVTAVLAGDAGDERASHEKRLALKQTACAGKP